MIKLLLFLANLEQKVKESKIIEVDFKKLQKEKEKYSAKIPSPTTGGKIKAGIYNIGKIAKNALDNTVGYPIVKYQNYKEKKYFKKHPDSKEPIIWNEHGSYQTIGSQRVFTKQAKKQGYHVINLKGYYLLSRKENAKKTEEQIEEFQKATKLKKPEKRNDWYKGHSTGADVGIYLAGNEKIKKYGIKHMQAVAPAPSGVEVKTFGQRLLAPLIKHEDVKKSYEARKNAVELAKRKPKVPVHVIAGKYDNLVPPSDAAYKHAEKHHIIEHPDSTHFGTSGGNKKMNQVSIDLLKYYDKKHKKAA